MAGSYSAVVQSGLQRGLFRMCGASWVEDADLWRKFGIEVQLKGQQWERNLTV